MSAGHVDEEFVSAWRRAAAHAEKRGERIVWRGGAAFPTGPDGRRVFEFSYEPIPKAGRRAKAAVPVLTPAEDAPRRVSRGVAADPQGSLL
ncbi:MAG: hypothetical protein ACJ8DZ_13745 [Allosphingosinicella sp.]